MIKSDATITIGSPVALLQASSVRSIPMIPIPIINGVSMRPTSIIVLQLNTKYPYEKSAKNAKIKS